MELCCNKIIREDKWLQHCKQSHAIKTRCSGDVMKRKTVQYKDSGGKCLNYPSNTQSSTADAASSSTASKTSCSVETSETVAGQDWHSSPKEVIKLLKKAFLVLQNKTVNL